MGFAISTTNMPRISSFAEAEAYWNKTAPWKNELQTWRSLAERRARHKRIVRIDGGDAYQCILFDTPLITYFRNGDVELQTHDSVSSRAFAWCVCPYGISVETARGMMYWGYPSQEGSRYVHQDTEPLLLKYVGTGQYNLATKPAEDFEWVLDRKKAAEVRKKLSHYKRWYELTARLGGLPKYESYGNHKRACIAALQAEPENIEKFVEFAKHIGPVQYQIAYEVAGASVSVPVPYDRLPRKQR